ncbi:MAG: hypothetical protein ACYCPT_11300 [Acidimicrobiales bacterium]
MKSVRRRVELALSSSALRSPVFVLRGVTAITPGPRCSRPLGSPLTGKARWKYPGGDRHVAINTATPRRDH